MTDMTPHLADGRPLFWSDFVIDLQDRLAEIEPQTPLYIVGGAVRDAYMHRPIKDLDFVTPKDAIKLARKMTNHLQGEIFIMDVERGVARIFVDTPLGKQVLDITQYRGDDLLTDLLERDFTINAMAVDFRGDLQQLIDPLNGEVDAKGHLLRRCAPHAISNDPIRALRAVRQSVQLKFHIETETLKDIRANANQIKNTSPERVRDEFFNLLSLDNIAGALRIADTVGILAHILPETQTLKGMVQASPNVLDGWQHTLYTIDRLNTILTAISPRRTDHTASVFDIGMLTIQFDRYRAKLNQHIGTQWANDRSHRPLLLLGALIHLIGATADDREASRGQMAERCAEDLRLSNAEKKRLVAMVSHYERVATLSHYDVLAAHRYWFVLEEAGIDAILLGMAHYLGVYGNEIKQANWLERVEVAIQLLSAFFDYHDTIVEPPLLLNGDELMTALNIPPSRMLGQLLTAIRESQVVGDIKNKEEALALARQRLLQ